MTTSAHLSDLAEQIWKELDHADSILLHFHPNPDGDSMGSALGLAHVLRDSGKAVTVIAGDSLIPEYLRHLPGVELVQEIPFTSVDQTQFDLFVILDSASKDQISKQSEVEFSPSLRTIVVDHHATNTGYADINWIDSSAPATAQLVTELVTLKDLSISTAAATCLLVGLYTDTGGFQYPPTGPRTFAAAATLAAVAPEYHQAIFPIHNQLSPHNVQYQGLALRNIQLFPLPDGKQLALSVVSAQERLEAGITPEFADKSHIANILKSVVGWDVAVGVVEIEPGNVKASFRTRNTKQYHVGNIAASLGGGGHAAAAGLSLQDSLPETVQKIVQAVQEYVS